MKTADRMLRPVLIMLLAALPGALSSGCATTGTDDPLKYTKKLAAEGHASLYHNGAFKVPNTSITLIPPGPSALEFAAELMGERARQSFLTSLENAAQSVYIVSEGTKLSYRTAKNVSAGSIAGADSIKKFSRENTTLLVRRSSELGKWIVGKSWDLSKTVFSSGGTAGAAVSRGSQTLGDRISETGTSQGTGLASGALSAAKDISTAGAGRSGRELGLAGRSFVRGYAAVPANMKKRGREMGDNLSDAKFGSIITEENKTRAKLSRTTVDLMADTVRNYPEDVAGSFRKAGGELSGSSRTTGLSLAVLKSLRWVLQGILWDATIEPLANMTAASVGYIGVNLAAFPSLVIVREGVATTKLAVEVTWDTAKMGYDLVAPTGTAALAGVYGLLDFTGSQAVAGTTAAAGTIAGYGAAGMSTAAGVIVKGGGAAAGKGVQYIGVPLASAGIALGGGTIGTVVGGAGAASGGALYVTGETASASTNVFGNVIAGATLAGGTAVSTAGGAAYGVYELSKAVVVPTGYELGGGMVLSYGTLAHLGAHTILAASDCSYMVLSLEGPRWVLYAVKGTTGSGDDLPVGAVVDLKKMQESGEMISNVPASDEEMKKVVESVYDNLPEI